MKRSKFSEAQIAFILRQADEGTPVAEVCRKAGISDATFCNWKKRYGGLTPSEVKRMRQLEDENNRLKKIVADLTLDKAMLQDILSKGSEACSPPAARDQHVVALSRGRQGFRRGDHHGRKRAGAKPADG
jgi:putative transposase